MEKTLVVAFDGLDKDLIEKYGLSNVVQNEFGTIDNQTNMYSVKTFELFASFITGKNYQEHGIQGVHVYHGTKRYNLIHNRYYRWLHRNVRGFHRIFNFLNRNLMPNKRSYDKRDLESESIFEKIDNSRAIDVPSWNPGVDELCDSLGPMKHGYSKSETAEMFDNAFYRKRKEQLFSDLENEFTTAKDFMMIHFFRPDFYQHFWGDYEVDGIDHDKLKKMYLEIDELAGEIKEKALEKGYERVIFMSDHGLPTEHSHNENAFYSCNKKLFGKQTPHITDFYSNFTS